MGQKYLVQLVIKKKKIPKSVVESISDPGGLVRNHDPAFENIGCIKEITLIQSGLSGLNKSDYQSLKYRYGFN
jgi:hypothetical protein